MKRTKYFSYRLRREQLELKVLKTKLELLYALVLVCWAFLFAFLGG